MPGVEVVSSSRKVSRQSLGSREGVHQPRRSSREGCSWCQRSTKTKNREQAPGQLAQIRTSGLKDGDGGSWPCPLISVEATGTRHIPGLRQVLRVCPVPLTCQPKASELLTTFRFHLCCLGLRVCPFPCYLDFLCCFFHSSHGWRKAPSIPQDGEAL